MAEPKVRFKRDGGSSYPVWRQGRFGDLIEAYDEKVTSDCVLPVLTSSKTKGIQYQSDHFGREQLHDITGYNVIPRGYCTYRNRSDGTDFTFNINELCEKGIVSKFYPVFHATEKCNLYFLMTLMNNEPKTVRKIAMTAKGTGQKVLSFIDLQKIEINIPCTEEQQKIADFLSSVDEVISTSEQEVANLETQKKAVMKKIFSQEVRFKRDDGTEFPEWEEKKIENITTVFSASRVHKEEWTENGVRFFRSSDVTSYFNGIENPNGKAYISEQLYKRLSAKSGKIAKNDILITGGGSVGIPYIVPDDEPLYVKDADLLCIRSGSQHDSRFLYQFFLSSRFREYLGSISHKGAIAHYTIVQVNDTPVPLPCLEEQRLIAGFLSDFDEAIAAAKKELELWKELKKGLLQQMFV